MTKSNETIQLDDDPKIKQAWDEAKEAIKKAQQEFLSYSGHQ